MLFFTRSRALFVTVCLALAVAACAPPNPTEPSSAVVGGQATSVKPPASPTPTPGNCTCTELTVLFDPGGAEPAWGAYTVKGNSKYRVGFRIDVTCRGTGRSTDCVVTQIENGSLTWTLGAQPGELLGVTKTVSKFHKVKLTDTWQKEYSDALGADYPADSTEKMSITLDMTFEIKCEPGPDAAKKKFRVEGTVEAQATKKGTQPTLTKPVIKYTPM
jgi:hypothetical protein